MLASALALALYARVEPWWVVLGWVGLVPFLAVLDDAATLREALLAALLMCVAFVLAVFGWFAPAIADYTGAPLVVAVLFMAAAAPLLEPQLVVYALARHLARAAARSSDRATAPAARTGFWRATLVGAAAYVGAEWAFPKLFADSLGHGLYAAPWMRQAADLAGVPGLTFVLVVANECVLAAARALSDQAPLHGKFRRAAAPAACVATLACGLLVYGAIRYRQFSAEGAPGETITAGVVQAGIAHYDRLRSERGTFETVRMILETHFTLSTEARARADLDLLVWPETVYPTTFGAPKSDDGAAFDRAIAAFTARVGVPLVFGGYDTDGTHEFNAAFFLEPPAPARRRASAPSAGESAPPGAAEPPADAPIPKGPLSFQTYRKTRLFPLTEHVPAVLDSVPVRRWLPWLGTWKPGAGPRVIALTLASGRTLRVAPLICYDVLDPALTLAAVRDGAEILVTLSNDSWFASGTGPRLHLVGAAFLSIEARRPQLRAANTGISALITATGDLVAVAGVEERAVLVGTVRPVRGVTTVPVACGEWLGPTALAAVTLLAALALGRHFRPRH